MKMSIRYAHVISKETGFWFWFWKRKRFEVFLSYSKQSPEVPKGWKWERRLNESIYYTEKEEGRKQ